MFDDDEPVFQAAARSLIGDSESSDLVISANGLAAFYDIVTNRLIRPLPDVTARRALTELSDLTVVYLDSDLVLSATDIANADGLALRDALAVQAAVTASCDQLVTETLPHGAVISDVLVQNLTYWKI